MAKKKNKSSWDYVIAEAIIDEAVIDEAVIDEAVIDEGFRHVDKK